MKEWFQLNHIELFVYKLSSEQLSSFKEIIVRKGIKSPVISYQLGYVKCIWRSLSFYLKGYRFVYARQKIVKQQK